jgi:hypothetical protein
VKSTEGASAFSPPPWKYTNAQPFGSAAAGATTRAT